MRYFRDIILLLSTLVLLCSCGSEPSEKQWESVNKLWYKSPADEWMKSLPQGNGRLGVTQFGGVEKETITLNEITMWAGQYDKNMHRPAGKKVVDKISTLLFEGDYDEGNRLATEHLAGNAALFGTHLPFANMELLFDHKESEVENYHRELNLNSALSSVRYNHNGVEYSREYICSNPSDLFVAKLSADQPAQITFDLSFDLFRESTFTPSERGLELTGSVLFKGVGGVDFFAKVEVVLSGGSLEVGENSLSVSEADEAVIVFDLRTNYKNKEYREQSIATVERAVAKGYDKIREEHIADHSALYNRAGLYLGKSPMSDQPTDVRWEKVKSGGNDVGLDALFFNYARYLLIAASRENSPLPANLQGIWNDNLACNMGWNNDYHLDINTQQNYWLSNIGNLHELNAPLFRYIEDLAHHGSLTASKVYGARGWTAHTVANVWGYTAGGGGVNWGLFPLGSSWIASHLWTQYEYTLDKEFLEQQAYPLLRSNAEFLLDYMVEHPKTGHLVGGPATSPENAFAYNDEHYAISMGTTADRQLAYEIFTYCIEASEILNRDSDFRADLVEARDKLSPIMIGENGGIQEWYTDFDEAMPNHRHTTHLLGLYPFSQITPEQTPELAEAARRTIELRLSAEGWEDVEWSRANMICMYARLYDPQKAYQSVVQLEREFARENLLTISPEGIAGAPYDIFIFDGNEAGATGIAEMLLQSHQGYIEFLPALPKEWSDGELYGFSMRGGVDVDLSWKNGKPKMALLEATSSNTFFVKVDAKQPKATLNGEKVALLVENNIAQIEMERGDRLELRY